MRVQLSSLVGQRLMRSGGEETKEKRSFFSFCQSAAEYFS